MEIAVYGHIEKLNVMSQQCAVVKIIVVCYVIKLVTMKTSIYKNKIIPH